MSQVSKTFGTNEVAELTRTNEVKGSSKSPVSNICKFRGESLKAEREQICERSFPLSPPPPGPPPAIDCIHISQRKYAITDNMITETLGVVRYRALAVG